MFRFKNNKIKMIRRQDTFASLYSLKMLDYYLKCEFLIKNLSIFCHLAESLLIRTCYKSMNYEFIMYVHFEDWSSLVIS